MHFGDRYYLYGTSYGCGYVRFEHPVTPFCGFVSYSSTDLHNWTPQGPLFDATTAVWQGRCDSATLSCYRPHVIYNAVTGLYVLWVNTYDGGAGYHVLTSTSPTGPFQDVGRPTMARHGGDMDLFVDDDGSAYLAYTDLDAGYNIVIEKLNPAYTSGTGQWTSLGLSRTEAPSIFKRSGTYYIDYSDPYCAYCAGTGTSYLRATNPLGPYRGLEPAHAEQVRGSPYDSGRTVMTLAGASWGNYDSTFVAVPQAAAVVQVGWMFRARDAGTGYLWLAGSDAQRPGYLNKVTLVAGRIVHQAWVRLPMAIVAGRSYSITTRTSGSTITT